MSKKPLKKRIKNNLIYYVILVFIRVMQSISRHHAFILMESAAKLAYLLAAGERKKTIRHLTIAFGAEKSPAQIKKMAEQVFINLARNAVDAIRLPLVINGDLNNLVKANGLENLERALAKGKGVMGLTGHIGNWELMASYLANNGFPIWAVGAKLYDSRLNDLIAQQRNSAGYFNIERGKATRQMFRALYKGDVVGVLIDQDTRVDGVFVDFFGRKAFTPVGPVSLALKTGCALVPMAIHIEEDYTHVLTVKPEIEFERTGDIEKDRLVNTEKCSKAIEAFIREQPTQWVWMHERWKTRPEGEKDI